MPIARRLMLGLAVAAFACRAGAQPQPLGADFQVNTFTPDSQFNPAIAAGSAATVIVWESAFQDGFGYGIFGRRYGSDGAALGGEFQVNTATSSSDRLPDVAMDGAGRFVVVWTDFDSKILGQRFSSDAAPLGTEFQVNTSTGTMPVFPRAVAAQNGDFSVVWDDDGTLARRYDSTGAPLGSEFLLSSSVQEDVGADASGRLVVVLSGPATIDGQRFDSTGAPLGTEFQVGEVPYDPGPVDITHGNVAVADSGAFAVVWHRRIEPENDSVPPTDILARVYDSAGQPFGTEFVVNEKHQYNYLPGVGVNPQGEFVVTWSGYRKGGYGLDVLARRISSSGAFLGGEFRVNSDTAAAQLSPKIAYSNASDFTVVWTNDPFPVAINTDVRARRMASAITTPICSDGAIAGGAQAKLAKLALPGGDEKILIKGALQFGPGTPAILDPATKGTQILVEDLGAGNAAIFELSTATTPVPGGAGCGPDDGWKANGAGTTFTYKNKSGALPPDCSPGSANGLSLIKVKDKRARGGGIAFKAKAKNATIPAVVGPLRVTLVLGATGAESAAGECGGTQFDTADCSASASGFKCRR